MKKFAAAAAVLVIASAACGKKGPPLPPLVRLPAAPGQFSVARQGNSVAIHLNVPTANTDASTPADVQHIEVYALTGPSTTTPDEIMKRGVRIADILVNPPVESDEGDDEKAKKPEKRKLPGAVDQGASVRLGEALTVDSNVAPDAVRSYLAVGFSTHGRRGPFSSRVLVPMGPPPPAPPQPAVTYNEKTITVTWPVPEGPSTATAAAVVPASTVSGTTAPASASSTSAPATSAASLTAPPTASTTSSSGKQSAGAPAPPPPPSGPRYQVYLAGDGGQKLNSQPLAVGLFEDHQIQWGVERCYVIRLLDSEQGLALESESSPATCVTPVDTFPPKTPSGLNVVAAEGAMNLIWDPNDEPDFAGYVVLRAIAPATELTPVTATPLDSATFKDTVPPGSRVTYAVRAVDKAGNASPPSARVEDVAR